MKSYQTNRTVRLESNTKTARFRGGKLAPVMATAIRGNEGGMVSQNIMLELDPIAGRMITPMYAELIAVFVPVQAVDALKNPLADYAGLTEVVREKLLSGNPLFGLEPEGEISKRLGINPRSIGGSKQVNEIARLAHNCAVNFLRQRKYVKATALLASNAVVTPALLSETILERMNGVLDPEDRVNGAVELQMGSMRLPIEGIGLSGSLPIVSSGITVRGDTAAHDVTTTAIDGLQSHSATYAGSNGTGIMFKVNGSSTSNARPDIAAIFDGGSAGNVSLTDFYNAEKQDAIVRTMRQIVDENPEYGEEMVLRWAHGLNVDTGRTPVVLAEKRVQFGRALVTANDKLGVEADIMRSDMMVELGFNIMAPKSELGGVIITFACLKPDETISSQPHPFLSDVWGADNFAADEMKVDPVPVTIRELDSDCTSGQESTVALYTGFNALKQTYINYGLGRQLDPTTVENKTALWQLEVPLSVTPDTILYPENLNHYPFSDQLAEVCTYTISSTVTLQTPMIVGPTPVEELAIIETENLFEEPI